MIQTTIQNFSLKAYDPYTPLLGSSMETKEELLGLTPELPASVPESIYKTLQRAGYISDPFWEQNSLSCEWVPNRWWGYRARFSFLPEEGRHYRLRIEHLDYRAHLWLNHRPLGDSENVSVPFCTDITSCLKSENVLDILVEHAPAEHGQIGYTSRTHTQKPRFNYKWDWCMRMVSLGIESPVYVEEFGATAIEALRTRQSFRGSSCHLSAELTVFGFEEALQELTVALTLREETVANWNTSVSVVRGRQKISFSLEIPDVKLWHPRGHGEQPLYELKATFMDRNRRCSDERTFLLGFRSVELLPCTGSRDALPYQVQINGKSIYLKGVNYLPPEMSQADITRERLETLLENIAKANCNLIRIWGGAYIGSEDLYEICDRLGILVWQEFLQSSSGIDNVPSKDPHFLRQLEETARAVIPRLRTHPSLLLYSGGNELTDTEGTPADFHDENIALLSRLVKELDGRPMLPTSASGPNEFLDPNTPGKNHDVHGPWKYGGVEGHYTLYNHSDSLLHSEFGVDGMANLSALERILSPKHLVVTNMRENMVWRHRGEWWDTYDRTCEIFGAFPPEALADFIKCSQYIQAEGLRYALEANRRRAFQNCGSIIWQYNEPCPNVSGTNLEDYYGEPKLAYYFVRDAFRPLTPSLRYEKLLWNPGESADFEATILNDSEAFPGSLLMEARSYDGTLLFSERRTCLVPENQNLFVLSFSLRIPRSKALLISLSLTGQATDVLQAASEYAFFIKDPNGTADRAVAMALYEKYKK